MKTSLWQHIIAIKGKFANGHSVTKRPLVKPTFPTTTTTTTTKQTTTHFYNESPGELWWLSLLSALQSCTPNYFKHQFIFKRKVYVCVGFHYVLLSIIFLILKRTFIFYKCNNNVMHVEFLVFTWIGPTKQIKIKKIKYINYLKTFKLVGEWYFPDTCDQLFYLKNRLIHASDIQYHWTYFSM
jgi:hypothetical protein